MRHRLFAALILPATLACAREAERQDTSAPREVAAPASAADREFRGHPNGFALLRDNDTIAVERYTRSADALRGEIRDAGSGNRITYTAALGTNDLVRRLEVSLFERDATEPKTRVRVEASGQILIAEQQEGSVSKTDTVGVPPNTLLYINPSIALMEQMLRRSRAVGGQRVELPVFSIATGEEPRLDRPTISRIGADSVEVVRERGNRVRMAVGADGRIEGGFNSSDVQIRRLP